METIPSDNIKEDKLSFKSYWAKLWVLAFVSSFLILFVGLRFIENKIVYLLSGLLSFCCQMFALFFALKEIEEAVQ